MQRWQAGHLYKANSAWHVRYVTTSIKDGIPKRVQKSKRLCDGDLPNKIVRQLFTEEMEKVNNQNFDQPSSSDTTVVDFWDTVYAPHIETNLKPSTIQDYQQRWNQHLKPHFGATLLNDYRTPMMSNFLTSLAKKYRPHTLKHIKFQASAIFSHAVATGHCESNPIRDAKVLGKTLDNGVTGAYSLEEIENVISALVDHVECQLIMALCFFLGLRKGEIAGLQWGDVDDNYLHVRRNITKGKGGMHLTTPKTKKSIRTIPLIAPVRVCLKIWWGTCGGEWGMCQGEKWVFPSSKGDHPVSLDRKADLIRSTLTKAGLPWKGFHAGRRGLGTTLRVLTGNSNAGRDMLGHSTSQVTEAHYEAAMPEEVLRGMKLLEAKSTK